MIVLLEDFKDGMCLGTQMSWARHHPDVIAQVQGWIDAGLLVCQGEPKPNPLMDHLFYIGDKAAEQLKAGQADKAAEATEKAKEPEGLRPAATKSEAELSFPYKRGREAKRQGRTEADCELSGLSRARWLAGYHGLPEPDVVSAETDAAPAASPDVASMPAASPAAASQAAGTSVIDAICGDGDLIEALANAHSRGTGKGFKPPIGAVEREEKNPEACASRIQDGAERSTLFQEDEDMATATAEKGKAKGSTTKSAKGTKGKDQTAEVGYRIEDEIVEKPLSWFTQSPFDKRSSRPLPWVKELAKSLAQDGQLTPCLARPDGQHIAGWTRVLAAPHAGLTKLQVRIVHCDDLTARRLVLIENAKRKELTEREQCEALNELLTEYQAAKKTLRQLASDLSMDHSTLANKTRLKTLPGEAWDRYESDTLSIDQMRQIATHAAVPGFADAVIKLLNEREPDRRPGPVCFADALAAGFEAAYRPMAKGTIEFKPSAKQKEELGITTVDHPRLGKIEVATNAQLWEQLNKEAADKKKEQQKPATEAPKSSAEKPAKPEPAAGSVAKHQEEQAAARQKEEIENAWSIACASSIAARWDKCKKSDVPLLMRLVILVEQILTQADKMTLKELLNDSEDGFLEECRGSVVQFFTETHPSQPDWRELTLAELQQIAAWLNVQPLASWKPTAELLATLNSFELLALRDECELEEGVLDGDRAELTRRIMDEWQPGKTCAGWCPKRFELAK